MRISRGEGGSLFAIGASALLLGLAACGDGGGGDGGSDAPEASIGGNLATAPVAATEREPRSLMARVVDELTTFVATAYAQTLGLDGVEVSAGGVVTMTDAEGEFDLEDVPAGDVALLFRRGTCEAELLLPNVANGAVVLLEDVQFTCESATPERVSETVEGVLQRMPASPNESLSVCVEVGGEVRDREVRVQNATFDGGTFEDLAEGDLVELTGTRSGEGETSTLEAQVVSLRGPAEDDPCAGAAPTEETPTPDGTDGSSAEPVDGDGSGTAGPADPADPVAETDPTEGDPADSSDPDASDPAEDGSSMDPAATDTPVTDSPVTDPMATESTTMDPTATDGAATDPTAATDPAAADPTTAEGATGSPATDGSVGVDSPSTFGANETGDPSIVGAGSPRAPTGPDPTMTESEPSTGVGDTGTASGSMLPSTLPSEDPTTAGADGLAAPTGSSDPLGASNEAPTADPSTAPSDSLPSAPTLTDTLVDPLPADPTTVVDPSAASDPAGADPSVEPTDPTLADPTAAGSASPSDESSFGSLLLR